MFIQIDLDYIKNLIKDGRGGRGERGSSGRSIESVMSGFGWAGFESAVAGIFEANGFSVERNVRFRTDRRYEVDIVASRHGTVFCVDCKDWGTGRHKAGALRRAAEDQSVRAREFMKFRESAKLNGTMTSKRHLMRIASAMLSGTYPIIVTLHDECMCETGGERNGNAEDVPMVPIIPVWKLNSFLNSA